MSNDDDQDHQEPSFPSSLSDHPLTKIPILQRVFLFAAKKLSTPLKLAAVTSSWDESLRIYGAGALVWQNAYKSKPSKATSFLQLACSKGGVPFVVDHMLQAGVDPNVADKNGITSLHMIAKWSTLSKHAVECIDILVKAGANVDAKTLPKKNNNNRGETALKIALVDTADPEATVALLRAGAKLSEVPPPDFGGNALHHAAKSGSGELVTVVLEELLRLNPKATISDVVNEQQPGTGITPLMVACLNTKRRYSATKVLLEKYKADITIEDQHHSLPFFEFMKGYTTTNSEAYNNMMDVSVEDWVKLYPDIIKMRNSEGMTVMHCLLGAIPRNGSYFSAASEANVKLALQLGADVNAKDTVRGYTPLHHLIDYSFKGIKRHYMVGKAMVDTYIKPIALFLQNCRPDLSIAGDQDGLTVTDMVKAEECPGGFDDDDDDGKWVAVFKEKLLKLLEEARDQ